MKKLKLLLLSLTFILSLCMATACGGSPDTGDGGDDPVIPPAGPVIEKVEGTAGLKYEFKTNAIKGTKYAICTGIDKSVTETDIVIASHYEGYLVKEIKQSAFKGNTKITSVKMVNGLEKINLYAFQNCTNLNSVVLPETLKSIGQNAFDGCELLLNVCNDSEIVVKKGDTMNGSVGNYACNIYSSTSGETGVFKTEGDFDLFYFSGNNYVLKYNGTSGNIVFPESTTGIYKDVFKGNTAITEVTIPATVNYIGKAAFAECTNLKKVTFPKGTQIQDIGVMAFASCNALTEFNYNDTIESYLKINFGSDTANPLNYSKHIRIDGQIPYYLDIPAGTKEIKKCAFVNCADLKTVYVAESVETISPYAFALSSVESITFVGTSKLKEIQNNAFGYCPKLKSIRIPKSIEKIKLQAFTECPELETVEIENNNNLKILENKAFYKCRKLKSFFVGHNSQLETVEMDCFWECRKLAKFSFGNNSKVKSIGASAFRECKPLKELYLPATCVTIGDWCFSGCFTTRKTDDLQIYSAALSRPSGWGNYFNSSEVDVFFNVPYPVLPDGMTGF